MLVRGGGGGGGRILGAGGDDGMATDGGWGLGLAEGVPGSAPSARSGSWTTPDITHHNHRSIRNKHLLSAYCVPGHVLGTGTQWGLRPGLPSLNRHETK